MYLLSNNGLRLNQRILIPYQRTNFLTALLSNLRSALISNSSNAIGVTLRVTITRHITRHRP